MIRAQSRLLPQFHFSPLGLLRQWHSLSRQRRALSRLDDAGLQDIGLTRDEARREAGRPFWDAPENWHI